MVNHESFFKRLATNLRPHSVIVSSVMFGLVIFIFALTRPWPEECVVQAEAQDHLQIKFARLDGSEIVGNYLFTKDTPQRTFFSLRPLKFTALSESAKFRVGEVEYRLNKNQSAIVANWKSLRFHRYQLFSMGMFSVLSSFLLYFILRSVTHLRNWVSVVLIVLTLTSVYGFTAPGIFLFDTYSYLNWAVSYTSTEFGGVLYGLLLTTLYQLMPSTSIVHLINYVAVLYVTLCVFRDVDSPRKKVFFWIGFLIVIFYPANFNFNISSNRDVIAMWVLGYFLLYLVKHRADLSRMKGSASFWFLLVTSCALRSEFAYVVILFSPLLLFQKEYKFFFGYLAVVCCLSIVKNLTIPEYDRNAYQSTALINPLSYILVTKYPEGIPRIVDEQLGKYFKNNFLIKHYGEYEIDPYHAGGVNFAASADDYSQFRHTALRMIFENFHLFIENRIKFFTAMFGFSYQKPTIGMLVEAKNKPYLGEILSRLGGIDELALGSNTLLRFFGRDLITYPTYVMNYSIAFFLLFLAFFSFDKSFYLALGLLLTRTAVVVLTAPAPMYKYNFVIWVFACFSFIYIQRKNAISEPKL